MTAPARSSADSMIAVVLELIESDGYDAVQVRAVAARAHVSLASLYKHFGSRDQLIVAAIQRWMVDNAYTDFELPSPGETPYDVFVRGVRAVFEPWKQNPRMLEAFYRASTGPGGAALTEQGTALAAPMAEEVFKQLDPAYVEDFTLIIVHVVQAALASFAAGLLDVSGVLHVIERALYRLTSDNRPSTVKARRRVKGPR